VIWIAWRKGVQARLVRFLSWAQNPLIKRVNTAFVLIVDNLSSSRSGSCKARSATIEIHCQMPVSGELFVPVAAVKSYRSLATTQVDNWPRFLRADAYESQRVLNQAARTEKRLDSTRFRQLKKSMIERQCQGLV